LNLPKPTNLLAHGIAIINRVKDTDFLWDVLLLMAHYAVLALLEGQLLVWLDLQGKFWRSRD
jgi:hypothetical protein